MDSEIRTYHTGDTEAMLDITVDCVSPGHGRSHVMPAMVAPDLSVPVEDGALLLGTWQSICLVDLNVDNHQREVRLSFLPG